MSSTKPNTMDKFKNPDGTLYTEQGIATDAKGNVLTNGKNLPQPTEEGAKPIIYNEDGSIFAPPADADKTIQQFKTDIAGLVVAIGTGTNKINAVTAMMGDADEADKPIFEKNINSAKIALESNQKAKEALEAKLAEFKLLLITPNQRRDEKILIRLEKELADKQTELAEHRNKMKVYNIAGLEKDSKKTSNATKEAAPSTDEQKANHAAMIAKHGSQGKAIVAMVKEGKTNTEIYKYLGCPPASVPGPKNAFLESADGIAWIAANPVLAEAIKK